MDKKLWPKGLSMAVAKLSLEPAQLTEQFGIEFFEGRDNLDEFRAALLRLDDRHEYALVRYLRSPDPGTEVWIGEDCPDVEEPVRLLLDTLVLSPDSIWWVHPGFDSENSQHLTTSMK